MRLLNIAKHVPIQAICFLLPFLLSAQQGLEIRGTVTDAHMKPLALATVRIAEGDWNISTTTTTDGHFSIGFTPATPNFNIILQISHVGKAIAVKTINASNIGQSQNIILRDLNLKLQEVEVNGIRRRTTGSNSSIIFDREAIEQSQALSIANVLNYLPGQTIVKPGVTVQGMQSLTMRSALSPNSIDALNNAFGIQFQVDGSSFSNDANMQAMNPGFMGMFSANNIQNPENSVVQDRGYRNGTLYKSYSNEFAANNGIDMRQIPAENIESIEIISGVASARYGDYTTGVINIQRQAGVTPLRINARVNEATQNLGLNKGLNLGKGRGVVNIGLDYLNSNDDPRNSLKSYRRLAGSLLWTYQENNRHRFKNTLSMDANTTLDQTKLDPDLGNDRMARFNNHRINISNRSSWLLKLPWIYDIQLQASYSFGRQESYDQIYLNGYTVKGITDAMTTGIFEGYYVPGYYLSTKQIIGIPVSASARVETNSIFKIAKGTVYKLTTGINYSYSANKGPGLVIDPDRPRFSDRGFKNDRPRNFRQTPSLSNVGLYAENVLTTKIAGRVFNANMGVRADIQNEFLTVSPRLSANYKISKQLGWNVAYGVATKAPSLSQVSPGNVFIDVPLINVYNGSTNESVYLAYTQVIDLNKVDIKPYRSNTFETGLTYDAKPFHLSAYYFNRVNTNGFTTQTELLPLSLPNYTVVSTPGQKPSYTPNGTYKTYNATYNRMVNGIYNSTNGVEVMIATDKVDAIATSFSINTAYYATYSKNNTTTINLDGVIRYDLPAVYGVFGNMESKLTNIKSTITSSTHIPALRMAIMMTTELFWVNNTLQYPSSIYPIGYYNKDLQYFALTPQQARSPEYAHLAKQPTSSGDPLVMTPAFVYPNIHLRMSKEIGDFLRFSFSAYNVFNIRPANSVGSGTFYFNGQPAYGAELIFSIK